MGDPLTDPIAHIDSGGLLGLSEQRPQNKGGRGKIRFIKGG